MGGQPLPHRINPAVGLTLPPDQIPERRHQTARRRPRGEQVGGDEALAGEAVGDAPDVVGQAEQPVPDNHPGQGPVPSGMAR
jgi:hypothetical protein